LSSQPQGEIFVEFVFLCPFFCLDTKEPTKSRMPNRPGRHSTQRAWAETMQVAFSSGQPFLLMLLLSTIFRPLYLLKR